MKKLIWLDDMRNPLDEKWIKWMHQNNVDVSHHEITWVKNVPDFVCEIKQFGLPNIICFDHDLGQDIASEMVKIGFSNRYSRGLKKNILNGQYAAAWLVYYCSVNNLDLPKWKIQSENIEGSKKIRELLNSFEL